MFEVNVTAFANQTKNYGSIIGAILGGLIAAGAGIYLSNYRQKKDARARQIIVAKALYKQMRSYYDIFELLLENYNTTKFDEALQKTEYLQQRRLSRMEYEEEEGPNPIKKFELSTLEEIRNLDIATAGKHATFIPELCPFSVFYEDIFKLDDIREIENLMQFHRYLTIADRNFKNYCNEDMEFPNCYDLRRFLDAIENAYSLMNEEPILDYLQQKYRSERSLWIKVRFYINKNRFKQLLHIK
jgi:hypothetical protein